MTNAYELRTHFFLEDYNTAITREDFETFFTRTKEKVIFTFNGWDGKSYDGESRRATGASQVSIGWDCRRQTSDRCNRHD